MRIPTWKITYLFDNYANPLLTVKEIAEKLSFTPEYVRDLADRLKLKRPNKWDAQKARIARQEQGYVITQDLGHGCQRRVRVLFHERA